MASNRINMVRGTTQPFEIDLVDIDGQPMPAHKLKGAAADFYLCTAPTETPVDENVLHFSLADSTHLALARHRPAIMLTLFPIDTSGLSIAVYVYQVKVTLANGDTFAAIDWSPFDLNLGGTADPVPPTFDNTVKVNEDYGATDALRYMSPGGTPIENAQVRVYLQSAYNAGMLGSPVGVTMTNAYGRWANPILITPGFSYSIVFMKPNEFGPDVATIVA